MEQTNTGDLLRVLMLEDTPTDAELNEHELRKAGLAFVTQRVETRDAFIRALEDFHPDVVLSDFNLPGFDGMAALEIMRQNHPEVPVIMVTGALPDIKAVELMHAGARDYVLKDRLARLAPSVQRVLSAERGARARKAAEQALRDSEARYRRITEGLTDYQYTVRIENGCAVETTQSPACVTVTGYSGEEFAADPELWIRMVAPDDRALVTEHARQILAGQELPPLEHRIVRKDGETRWVSDTTILLKDAAGKLLSYDGVIKDITERKQAQARIQTLTRLYAALSHANTTIVHAKNRDELFREICKGAVVYGKFAMAWVGVVNEATHRVVPVCHYGDDQGYLTDIVVSIDDVLQGRGPTGTAVRENRVICVKDFATDERMRPWREAALARGFHGSASLPLRFHGRAIGALSLYSGEPNYFDGEQMALLEEMALDISFALDNFEQEALRRRAEEERANALTRLKKSLDDCIRMAASVTEMRDPYTSGHQQRVSRLATAIAGEMGLSAEQIEGVHFGSLIHDVGKMAIPAEILSKPGQLSEIEFMLIKTHSQAGYNMLKEIDFPWPVARMILQHHERLDGSGYPSGLKGDEIILEAKILTVADVVEAMSSHRPYRPSLGVAAALAEIERGRGLCYDPQVVDVCINLFRSKNFDFSNH